MVKVKEGSMLIRYDRLKNVAQTDANIDPKNIMPACNSNGPVIITKHALIKNTIYLYLYLYLSKKLII